MMLLAGPTPRVPGIVAEQCHMEVPAIGGRGGLPLAVPAPRKPHDFDGLPGVGIRKNRTGELSFLRASDLKTRVGSAAGALNRAGSGVCADNSRTTGQLRSKSTLLEMYSQGMFHGGSPRPTCRLQAQAAIVGRWFVLARGPKGRRWP